LLKLLRSACFVKTLLLYSSFFLPFIRQ